MEVPAPQPRPLFRGPLSLAVLASSVGAGLLLGTDAPAVALVPLAILGAALVMLHLQETQARASAAARPTSGEPSREDPGPAPVDPRFVASMSRELRTPMNGILGTSELLLSSALDGEQQEFARTIHESARSLLAVVDQVQDLARLELGDLRIDSEEFRLRTCVQEVVESLYPALARRGVELNHFVDTAIPRVVRGDARRLRTVMDKLLLLAARGGGPASMRLDVTKQGLVGQDLVVRFHVSGVTEPLAAAREEDELDTAIARGLVALMGGELHQTEHELAFDVRFSYVGAPKELDDDVDALEGARLLVVDDSPVVRSIVRTHAQAWGMRVAEAGSASEGIDAIRRASAAGRPFDVALFDQEMPSKGGREAARLVRVSPWGIDTRLVLLAVLGRRIRPGQLLRDGFDAWTTKPLGSQKLRTVLLHVIAGPGHARLAPEPPPEPAVAPAAAFDVDVLVVEDNVVNQKVAQLLLDKLGCRTWLAPDGRAALRAVHEHVPDLILMDCHMPVMDGFEATRRLRQSLDERVRRIPIVAMTAGTLPADRDLCLQAGMNDHLAKPVRTEVLRQVLEQWVGSHPNDPGDERMNQRETLDREVIRSLKELGGEDDPGLFEELVNLFLDDTPPRIQELNSALVSGDAHRLERAAHALKSSTANLGAMALSELFREIEQAGKRADLSVAQGLVTSSEQEYSRVVQALRAELD